MNLQKPHFIDLQQNITQTPQDQISIDLLGPYNITSQGNSYTIAVVCNLTGYLMTTPIKDKKTTAVATNLFSDIMLKFSKLIEYLSQQLVIKKTYIFPYPPQANGKLESSHRFIKDCIHNFTVDGVLE